MYKLDQGVQFTYLHKKQKKTKKTKKKQDKTKQNINNNKQNTKYIIIVSATKLPIWSPFD